MEECAMPSSGAVERRLPIPGWEDRYEVSDRGRVRSLDKVVAGRFAPRTVPGRVMRTWSKPGGPQWVGLARNDKKENWKIDALVEAAFNPPPPPPASERWLPVPGFEQWYEVSDLGRVRSWHLPSSTSGRRKTPRILRPVLKNNGYLMVTLRDGDRLEYAGVHVLVLTTFVGPRPPGWIEGRHGPAGKLDNSLANLCWGTMHENHLDRIRDDAVVWGERHANAKLTAAAVLDCRRRFAAGEVLTALAREYGVSVPGLSQAVNGITWRHLHDDLG